MAQELVKRADQRVTVRGWFEAQKGEIARAVPKHIDPERLVRVALTACVQNPALLNCTRESLMQATLQSASLGLMPDGVMGQAYLIPYGDKAQFQIGYQGLIELAYRTDRIAAIIAQVDSTSRRLDAWEHKFTQARALLEAVASGGRPAADAQDTFTRLLRMMVTRDERLMLLASRYLDLSDVLAIKQRMIGTGLVCGKSAGILLARAILCKTDRRWHETLEPHDSFYVGSDVFYTYLVRNDCWRIRRNQRNPASFLDGADEGRERILNGTFPPAIVERCVVMLEYFGQSPIIVRSSSLLEDSFGNAFTGKYDSVFCPNQGAPSERLAALLQQLGQNS